MRCLECGAHYEHVMLAQDRGHTCSLSNEDWSSIAKEVVESANYYTIDKVVDKAVKITSIEERFKGANILTFEDGSQALIKKMAGGYYLTVICDVESYK